MQFEPRQSLTDVKREVDESVAWLKLHLKNGAENRFLEVAAKMEHLAERYDEKTLKLTEDIQQSDLFLAAVEARNLNKAVRFLRQLDKHHLPKDKIRRMSGGPTWLTGEKILFENSEGRDTQFEFILSDYLTNQGFKVLRHDDIEIELAGSLIQIECKRPWFTKNFKSVFDKGIGQLSEKIEGKKNTYGFLAVAVDKYEQLDDKLFRGSDHQAVFDRLRAMHNDIRKSLRGNMMLSSNKKIAGVLFYLKTYLWNSESGAFLEVNLHALEKITHEKSDPLMDLLYREFLERIQVN